MTHSPALRNWLLAFMALSLLWARLGGTHLHLCLDDQDARASVHLERVAHVTAHDRHHTHDDAHGHGHAHGPGHAMADSPAPHGAEHATSHTDLDVPLLDELLTKTGKPGQELPALLLALLAFILLPPATAPTLHARRQRIRPAPRFPPRPPSQAPPAPAS